MSDDPLSMHPLDAILGYAQEMREEAIRTTPVLALKMESLYNDIAVCVTCAKEEVDGWERLVAEHTEEIESGR